MIGANFEQAFRSFSLEAEKFAAGSNTKTYDINKVAADLVKRGLEFRSVLFEVPRGKTLKDVLIKDVVDMMGVAERSLTILGSSSLQMNDLFKRNVSKIARVFHEVVIAKCVCENRQLYTETTEEHVKIIDKVLETLPDKEVDCRFDLECCREALKSLAFGTDTIKTAMKSALISVATGSIKTLLSSSASPPYVNPSALVDSFVACVVVAKDVFDKLPAYWYRNVLALKWMGIEVSLKTLADYEPPAQTDPKKTLRGILKRGSSNAELAMYICQIFREIIESPNASHDLKKRIFDGNKNDPFSLAALAEYNPSWFKITDNHWRVRFLALTYLDGLIDKDIKSYDTSVSRKIIIRQMTAPNEKDFIRRYAADIAKKIKQKDTDAYNDMIREIYDELKSAVRNNVRIQELEEQCKDKQQDIKETEDALKGEGLENNSLSESSDNNLEEILTFHAEVTTELAALNHELVEARDASARLDALKNLLPATFG